jgi:hypothetical protein
VSDFRDDAELDTSQVEDMRGSSGRTGLQIPDRLATGGGVGIVVVIVL